jgi:hypothetical protein
MGSWKYYSVTGATSVVGTSGATFYITGVQLETGTTATDFENLQYGTQLSLCQNTRGSRLMLSILSAVLGFATSGLPSVLKFFEQKGDQKHEQEMAKLDIQRTLELAKAGYHLKKKLKNLKPTKWKWKPMLQNAKHSMSTMLNWVMVRVNGWLTLELQCSPYYYLYFCFSLTFY